MRQLKVAILHREDRRRFTVRCAEPLAWLKGKGAIAVLPFNRACDADLAYIPGIERWPGSLGLVRMLQTSGIRVVADCDEDILALPDERGVADTRRVLETVDAITVPTPALAESLSRINSNVRIAANGIDVNSWTKLNPSGPRKPVRTVGFCGTASHAANLDLLRPVLAKLAQEFKVQNIRFVCFGIRPPWLAGTISNAGVTTPCSGTEFPGMLAKTKIDIALVPLAHTQVNKCRSALRFYEFASLGAVTIASRYGEFGAAIEDGATGLLVENDPESWLRAIRKLIRNDDLRLQILQAARQELQSHDLSVTAPQFLSAFENTKPDRSRAVLPVVQSHTNPFVDIVMPVRGDVRQTRQAIEAVLPELCADHRLIVVADAPEQTQHASLLDEYSGRPWITVDHSRRHSNSIAARNYALQELVRPTADVVLMNSDTVPMRGFVNRLAAAAYSDSAIGTVTAVSNNGSIASVPNVRDAAEISAELNASARITPYGSSHLMHVKRNVIDKYGVFDAGFFGDNAADIDFSVRIAPEYMSAIDPRCWCQRPGSPAFRPFANLGADDEARLRQKHRQFRFEADIYCTADPLAAHRGQMIALTRDTRPRVLQVLHTYTGGGGTEKHAQELGTAIEQHYLTFGAAPDETLKLYCGTVSVAEWPYQNAGWPLTSSNVAANDHSWLELLQNVKPDVIHVHHLLNHPLSLLTKLAGTGAPVIVSIHDYYFLCPDFHLQQCPGLHSCDTCFPQQFKGPAQYQALRRELLKGSLHGASAIVAPSHSAANLIREVYPGLNIRVIPHGIPDPEAIRERVRHFREKDAPGNNVRFGMIGNVLPVKGIELIFKVWPAVARQTTAELHIYGAAHPMYIQRCSELGIDYHGPYGPSDLPQILSQIDVGLLPVQSRETFSYTLSEFFAGGVPVIGSEIGAVGERIEHGVNGLKVPATDVVAWFNAITSMASDPGLREGLAHGVHRPKSLTQMAADYSDLYQEVLQQHRTRAVPGTQNYTTPPPAHQAVI